jgi:lysophospholipase L1-like esterase
MLMSCSLFTPTNPILLIGDSIVGNFPVAELLPGRNLSTWGIYAAYIETLSDRIRDIIPLRSGKIIVAIGINNLQRGDAVEEIAAPYDALLARLIEQSPMITIIVQAVLPNMDGRISRAYLAAANEAIQEAASKHGLAFIDPAPAFLDVGGNVRPELFEGSVHLTPAGYRAWADFLRRYL